MQIITRKQMRIITKKELENIAYAWLQKHLDECDLKKVLNIKITSKGDTVADIMITSFMHGYSKCYNSNLDD